MYHNYEPAHETLVLLYQGAGPDQTSLCHGTVSQEPSLLTYIENERSWRLEPKIRLLFLLGSWVCTFKEWFYVYGISIISHELTHIFLKYSNTLTLCQLGNLSWFFVFCWFFPNYFWKIHSVISSVCQTGWIQIRPDVLSRLIWVQTICEGYQQRTLVGKELKAIR